MDDSKRLEVVRELVTLAFLGVVAVVFATSENHTLAAAALGGMLGVAAPRARNPSPSVVAPLVPLVLGLGAGAVWSSMVTAGAS